ncbi:MAG: hypothetical protein KC777_06880 [Cyanobacteria bacterium HKST-UBA02]|nr:hypothetical protein [Cyanobacteria bacterium HKST-UBA02]
MKYLNRLLLLLPVLLVSATEAVCKGSEKIERVEEIYTWKAEPNPFLDSIFVGFNIVTVVAIVVMVVCGGIWLFQKYVLKQESSASAKAAAAKGPETKKEESEKSESEASKSDEPKGEEEAGESKNETQDESDDNEESATEEKKDEE